MPTDPELLARCAGGDSSAFESLVERHQEGLLRYALRRTGCRDAAQDLVQETFLRLIRHAGGLAQGNGGAVWLYRVCRNLCTDHARKEARRMKRHAQVAVPEATEPEVPSLERSETGAVVRRRLAELPRLEREVLLLKLQQGLSYRDMAAVLGLSVHQVSVHLQRGLFRLARGLRESGLA